MGVVDFGTVLRFYKRPEIQKAIVDACVDREVSIRRIDESFGKRPDVLMNNSDVVEQAKQRASSFHCSEEHWINPLQITTGMRKGELDDLRSGWDLVLDIDCPFWELSKITTWLFIEALKSHGITSISLKFSGNKGFHIGVPFKAFPEFVPGKDILTKDYFPEGPRRIAEYLLNYIEKHLIRIENNNDVIFGNKIKYTFKQLQDITGKTLSELSHTYAVKNGREVLIKSKIAIKPTYHYQCASCGNSEKFQTQETIVTCKKCGKIMYELGSAKKEQKQETYRRFNPLSIIDVDTILIASRHLYRSVYSLHEKSGLVSIPIPIDHILDFEKSEAGPASAQVNDIHFLDDSSVQRGEAEHLLKQAFDYNPDIVTDEDEKRLKKAFGKYQGEEITQKIPEELFPPCIKLMLNGVKDGRKRVLFILINFLNTCGWNPDEISDRIHEWNKKNDEELRETVLNIHLGYLKTKKEKVPPPNCPDHTQAQYYRDMGLCHPDSLCGRIKNPSQYAKKRAWIANQNVDKRKKKTKDKTNIKSETT